MQKKTRTLVWVVFTPDLKNYTVMKHDVNRYGYAGSHGLIKTVNEKELAAICKHDAACYGVDCDFEKVVDLVSGSTSDEVITVSVFAGIAKYCKVEGPLIWKSGKSYPAIPYSMRYVLPLCKAKLDLHLHNYFEGGTLFS